MHGLIALDPLTYDDRNLNDFTRLHLFATTSHQGEITLIILIFIIFIYIIGSFAQLSTKLSNKKGRSQDKQTYQHPEKQKEIVICKEL